MKTVQARAVCALIIGVVLLAFASPLPAYAEAGTVSRTDLMSLAKQFVDRVGSKFKQVDKSLAPLENPFDRYEDGEILFLQIMLPDKLIIDRTVTAIKQHNDVLILLDDFVTAADFPITVNTADKHAEGWFIREDNPFVMDMASHTVTAGVKTFQINNDDIMQDENGIYIRGQTLAQWFGFTLMPDLEKQFLNITPTLQWPVQEKLLRDREKNYNQKGRPPPSLPLQEDPYEIVSAPNADLQVINSYRHPEKGETTLTTTYTSQFSGDIAGHSGKLRITGNDQDRFSSARIKLYKDSTAPELLGPLKARHYEVGDVDTASIPLAGGSASELGARISNKDPYVTYETTVQITGDATPGWDVELFRDTQRLATVTVDDDGRYVFTDVPLFAKENTFRIVKYGPQGQVEEEHQTYNVDPTLYKNKHGLYDVSVSLQNSETYRSNPSRDEDKNALHVVADYERQLNENLVTTTGLQARQEDGKQKFYGQAGLVATYDNTIINADASADTQGAYAASITGRHRIERQNISARAQYFSENFGTGESADKPAEFVLGGVINGALPGSRKIRPTYSIDSEYRHNDIGQTTTSSNLNLSANLKAFTINNTLNYETDSSLEDNSNRFVDKFALDGRAFNMFWRFNTDYQIKPENQFQGYDFNLTRYIDKNLSLSGELSHDMDPAYTSGRFSVNWLGKYAIISPSIAYDTNNTLSAYLNLRTGLTKDPYSNNIVVSKDTLTDKGGVSARVFLDKDGDNNFSKDDELLEDVTVKALHASRQANTDKEGVAFIYNIPDSRVTDVFLDEASFTDPAWISGFRGVSIRPRAGHVSHIDFPVHMAGELDGTIYSQSQTDVQRTESNLHIALYDENGKVVQSAITDSDGYYWMGKIPPGKYVLLIDGRDPYSHKLQAMQPEEIIIGYEGTLLYGHNIILEQTDLPIAIVRISGLDKLLKDDPAFEEANLQGAKVLLNLGTYKSSLMMGLTWYKLRTFAGKYLAGAAPLVNPTESYPSVVNGLHTLRAVLPKDDTKSAYERCAALAGYGYECTVEVLPARPAEQVIGMK